MAYEQEPEPEVWASPQYRLEFYRRQEKLKLLGDGKSPSEATYRLAWALAQEKYDRLVAEETAAREAEQAAEPAPAAPAKAEG